MQTKDRYNLKPTRNQIHHYIHDCLPLFSMDDDSSMSW